MTSTERARAHAKHGYYCTCGQIVYGNGARWSHAAMHRRREIMDRKTAIGKPIPEHHYITQSDFIARRGG